MPLACARAPNPSSLPELQVVDQAPAAVAFKEDSDPKDVQPAPLALHELLNFNAPTVLHKGLCGGTEVVSREGYTRGVTAIVDTPTPVSELADMMGPRGSEGQGYPLARSKSLKSVGMLRGARASRGPAPKSARRFIVFCQRRWRVRTGPSLEDATVGTLANGAIVIGELKEGTSNAVGAGHGHPPSWIKIHSILRGADEDFDAEYEGPMYCFHRNPQNFGLFEDQRPSWMNEPVGPLSAPLRRVGQRIVDDIAIEDAQASDDLSCTWKVLEPVQNVKQLFDRLSSEKEIGSNKPLEESDVVAIKGRFAEKYREQLRRQAQELCEVLKPFAAQERLMPVTTAVELTELLRRLDLEGDELNEALPPPPPGSRSSRLSEFCRHVQEHGTRPGTHDDLADGAREAFMLFCLRHLPALRRAASEEANKLGDHEFQSSFAVSHEDDELSIPAVSVRRPMVSAGISTPAATAPTLLNSSQLLHKLRPVRVVESRTLLV